ncbi:hypothetical protein LWI29_026456 [Acer saccharum]|uniref:Signal recognition particle receptor subunit beta n=1 Tax=Acer saccharum TaxID=4024 RepID=A0AA39RZP8_ACESA|nr:hypothetical protein LWI29_026456 [Acer saccharum]
MKKIKAKLELCGFELEKVKEQHFCSQVQLFRRTKSNTIVLTGLSGSGKTVLFYQLQDGSSHQGTVTSNGTKQGHFLSSTKTRRVCASSRRHSVHCGCSRFLIELPGSFRVRYLSDFLTKSTVVKKKIPVLICCNKTDKLTAHTKVFIRKQLEKEIDKLRTSRSEISAADVSNDFTLGGTRRGLCILSESQCHNNVTVTEASGLTGEVSSDVCTREAMQNVILTSMDDTVEHKISIKVMIFAVHLSSFSQVYPTIIFLK